MNSVTAFVDGSAIYGSSEERMRVLRENNGTGSVVGVSSVSRLLLLKKKDFFFFFFLIFSFFSPLLCLMRPFINFLFNLCFYVRENNDTGSVVGVLSVTKPVFLLFFFTLPLLALMFTKFLFNLRVRLYLYLKYIYF